MASDIYSETIALAALFQSAAQIQRVARFGAVDEHAIAPLMRALVITSPNTIEDVYAPKRVIPGLNQLLTSLYPKEATQPKNAELIKIAFSIINLEANLEKQSMVFAQLERETTAERVRDNYYQRTKLGSWPGGPAPFGFSIGKLPGPEGKLAPGLLPNEQAAVVERIFRGYAQPEATLGSVARWLNADGIPAPKRATWDNVALSRILHSPLYVMADEDVYLYYQGKGLIFANQLEEFDGLHAGMVVGKRDRSAGKYQDLKEQHFSLSTHYGLIPSELWLQCQYKLDRNRQLAGAGRGRHSWLSGLLKCATCGYSIKVNRDKDRYYLVCSGRSNLGLCEASIRVGLRELEAAVAAELEKLLAECPDVEEHTAEDQETAQALAGIDQKIERLMSALVESSDLTMPYINRTIEKLEAQRGELLEHQAKLYAGPRPKLNRLKFGPLDFEQKKLVAARFIQEVRLSGETAEVIWKV